MDGHCSSSKPINRGVLRRSVLSPIFFLLFINEHGSGTSDTNSFLLLNFANSSRLRIAGSWYQRSELYRWTWYSNAGVVAKTIDHIFASIRWRILQNCRVFQSFKFYATDHRLAAATLKPHLTPRKILRCDHNVFHLEKLKNSWVCTNLFKAVWSTRRPRGPSSGIPLNVKLLKLPEGVLESVRVNGVDSLRRRRWII